MAIKKKRRDPFVGISSSVSTTTSPARLFFLTSKKSRHNLRQNSFINQIKRTTLIYQVQKHTRESIYNIPGAGLLPVCLCTLAVLLASLKLHKEPASEVHTTIVRQKTNNYHSLENAENENTLQKKKIKKPDCIRH